MAFVIVIPMFMGSVSLIAGCADFVQIDSENDYETGCKNLPVLGYVEQVQAVHEDSKDEGSEDGSANTSMTAAHGCSANHRGCDCVGFVSNCDGGLTGVDSAGEDDAGYGSHEAAEHEGEYADFFCVDSREPG